MNNGNLNRSKTISLVLLSISLLAVIVLAASLSNLSLHPGAAFTGDTPGNLPDRDFATLIPEDSVFLFILRGVLAFVLFAFLFYLVARLVTGINLRTVGIALLILVALAGVIFLLPKAEPSQITASPNDYTSPTLAPEIAQPTGPIGESSQLLLWLAVIAAAGGIGFIAVKSIKEWLNTSRRESGLLQNAQEAVDALEAGGDFRNVILRCYFQMANTLKEEQELERDSTMTVREFEDALAKRGYPAAPVHRLTALFEMIRYGEQDLGVENEAAARESLDEIIQHARQGGEEVQ